MAIFRRSWLGFCVSGCLVTLLASACAPASEAPGRSGPTNNSAQRDDGAGGINETGGGSANLDEIVGQCEAKVEPARLPPRVMLLLDRSESMNNCTDGGQDEKICASRWKVARDGLVPFLNASAATVAWGLKTFPDQDSCSMASRSAVISIGSQGKAADIVAWLNSRVPKNVGDSSSWYSQTGPTNTGHALAATALSESFTDAGTTATRKLDAILLVTDGGESSECRDESTGGNAAAQAAKLWSAGVPVYVLGFMTDATRLNSIASAGGTGDAKQADATGGSLGTALSQIAGEIAPCKYALDRDDPNLTVVLDQGGSKSIVKQGWKVNGRTLELDSTLCDPDSSATQSVDVYYNCANVI